LFVTRSNVTNASGVEWLRRHLGSGYRIHEIESRCPNPMHIDTTILPLGPGKILINPEYIDPDRLPDILKKWDLLVAPEPDPIDEAVLKITSLCGKWLNMNVLMVDDVLSSIRIIRDDACDEEMGIRGDSLPVPALCGVWRGLPLRHA
jgi:glycine amidinotransferase